MQTLFAYRSIVHCPVFILCILQVDRSNYGKSVSQVEEGQECNSAQLIAKLAKFICNYPDIDLGTIKTELFCVTFIIMCCTIAGWGQRPHANEPLTRGNTACWRPYFGTRVWEWKYGSMRLKIWEYEIEHMGVWDRKYRVWDWKYDSMRHWGWKFGNMKIFACTFLDRYYTIGL